MIARLLITSAALLAALVPVAPASATEPGPRRCASADLRYAFQEGQPKHFGVWRLRITGDTCATAHRVAERWQERFEASPTGRLPRRVLGFRFRQLPPKAAQTYRLRGTTRSGSIVRFDYMVPNG